MPSDAPKNAQPPRCGRAIPRKRFHVEFITLLAVSRTLCQAKLSADHLLNSDWADTRIINPTVIAVAYTVTKPLVASSPKQTFL
jgi:hypothetical protein